MTPAELNDRFEKIEADYRSGKTARHDTLDRMNQALNEERVARMELEKTVSKMAFSVQRLVDAMSGGELGQDGVMTQLRTLRADVTDLKNTLHQGRGMVLLLSGAAFALGLYATVRGIVN